MTTTSGGATTTRRGSDVLIAAQPLEVRRALVAVIFLLTMCHLVFVVAPTPLSRVFDLDLESGIGTWVSSTLFTVAVVLSFLLALVAYPGRRSLGLAALGFIMVALGMEEVAAFHESASLRVADAAHVGGTYSGGTPLMGLALLPFAAAGLFLLARGMSSRARSQLFLGGVVWYLATFLTEQVDAWNLEGAVGSFDTEEMHRLVTAVQEGGEMLGVTLVICGLLYELAAMGSAVALCAVAPELEGDES